MKRANRLMLVAGVVLAAIAFIVVLAMGGLNQQQNPAPVTSVPAVVAASDLALGTQLAAGMLTTTTLPVDQASGTFQHPEELVGRVVRKTVGAGQPLTSADFETDVAVNLSQSLQPGLLAIAIPLSRVDSVGALLQTGDFVDVLLSLEENDALNPIVVANPNAGHTSIDGTVADPYISIDPYINNTTVKIVVQNVQVLATIERQVNQGDAADPNATLQPDLVVVLAVTPQQAEVVRFAQLDGNVSLALRAPGDGGAADTSTTGITLKQLVDYWGVLPPKPVTP